MVEFSVRRERLDEEDAHRTALLLDIFLFHGRNRKRNRGRENRPLSIFYVFIKIGIVFQNI
jgi:hypothetical protein